MIRHSATPILALEIPRLRLYHLWAEKLFEYSLKNTYIPVIATKHAPFIRTPHYAYGHTRIGKLVISGPYML